jgi:uncharacterized DUF497 family protein
MAITFDPDKNARNIATRDLSFESMALFEWDSALVTVDTRKDYGEIRLRVLGLLNGRVHAAVVTPRGQDLRVISLRRASRKEIGFHEEATR